MTCQTCFGTKRKYIAFCNAGSSYPCPECQGEAFSDAIDRQAAGLGQSILHPFLRESDGSPAYTGQQT